MDIIDMARQSGMAVILDARIGREEYHSVCGSLSALQKFADAIRYTTANHRTGDKRQERPARGA
ncbi:hypothetical protein RI103_23380 [Paraburkholderia sp. FT54]|jgi:hypothetical protein|uniref:hypothetical protein n=1 Tax=Paraburkholderia sp. FT54 TaxID=3074437 RepID=UPI0028774308|nr:hypothetical protein [Paraburkholderia sp. FT54]WNC93729.1 hypothetical protein RI103_23380 [Paraburkholderia sp. FT54]